MAILSCLLLFVVVTALGGALYTYLHKEQERIKKTENQYDRAWGELLNERKSIIRTRTIRRIKIVLIALSFIWFLLWVYFLSDGIEAILDLILDRIGLVVITGVSLAFLFLIPKIKGENSQSFFDLFRHPSIYVVVLSFIGFYLLDSYSVPFQIRFKLSQQALESFAKHPVLSYDHMMNQMPQQVGLFSLREVDRLGTTVGMIVGTCHLLDSCGFVYSPDGEPPQISYPLRNQRDSYLKIPFAENWYYWRRALFIES